MGSALNMSVNLTKETPLVSASHVNQRGLTLSTRQAENLSLAGDSIAVVKVIPATPQAEYKLWEPVVASRDGDSTTFPRESISPALSETVKWEGCQVPLRTATGGYTLPVCR